MTLGSDSSNRKSWILRSWFSALRLVSSARKEIVLQLTYVSAIVHTKFLTVRIRKRGETVALMFCILSFPLMWGQLNVRPLDSLHVSSRLCRVCVSQSAKIERISHRCIRIKVKHVRKAPFLKWFHSFWGSLHSIGHRVTEGRASTSVTEFRSRFRQMSR